MEGGGQTAGGKAAGRTSHGKGQLSWVSWAKLRNQTGRPGCRSNSKTKAQRAEHRAPAKALSRAGRQQGMRDADDSPQAGLMVTRVTTIQRRKDPVNL